MTPEKMTTLRSLLGELADELTSAEYIDEESRVVDCIQVILEFLREK